MKSWVINLPSATTRKLRAIKRANAVGLRPEIFQAVDGSTVSLPNLAGLSPGEQGCFLSHRRILDRIVDSAEDFHLVLEDDVIFFPSFEDAFPAVVDAMRRESLGLVQVGWLPTDDQLRRWPRARDKMAAFVPVRRAYSLLRPSTPAMPPPVVSKEMGWGTHCYLISRDYAPVWKEFIDGAPIAAVDYYMRALSTVQPGRVRRTRFPLAGQDWSFGSSVHPGRFAFQRAQLDSSGRKISPAKNEGSG